MQHIILGLGNLGFELKNQIKLAGYEEPIVMTLSKGFDITKDELIIDHPEQRRVCVWLCVGGISIAETEANPKMARKILYDAPLKLARYLPRHAYLVVFSTDYVANEDYWNRPSEIVKAPRSLYARFKMELEIDLMKMRRPRTSIVRIGSLYGQYKPEQTLPAKLIRNALKNEVMFLPSNLITPTPARWAAHNLVIHFNELFSEAGTMRHHLAPEGNISVLDFGRMVLRDVIDGSKISRSIFYDEKRPIVSHLGCSFIPPYLNFTWQDLFLEIFDRDLYLQDDSHPG